MDLDRRRWRRAIASCWRRSFGVDGPKQWHYALCLREKFSRKEEDESCSRERPSHEVKRGQAVEKGRKSIRGAVKRKRFHETRPLYCR